MLADDLFAKALRRLVTRLSVNNILTGKLVLSSPIIFDDYLRVTLVAFFDADFYLFSCEADNLSFTVLY